MLRVDVWIELRSINHVESVGHWMNMIVCQMCSFQFGKFYK